VLVVRGRIELPTPRFSGTRDDANRAKYGEPREIAVAESIVGWTDLDGGVGRWGWGGRSRDLGFPLYRGVIVLHCGVM
jgi:hypothetical protein